MTKATHLEEKCISNNTQFVEYVDGLPCCSRGHDDCPYASNNYVIMDLGGGRDLPVCKLRLHLMRNGPEEMFDLANK